MASSNHPRRRRAIPGATLALLLVCGSPSASEPSPGERAAAAAQGSSACRKLGDFHWQIGDASAVLAAGDIGSRYQANTEMNVASASKWVFGAYTLERLGAEREPGGALQRALRMQTGHSQFDHKACTAAQTVRACYEAGSNAKQKEDDLGHYYYSGGHSQYWAVSAGLGEYDAAALSLEVNRQLGSELGFHFSRPQPGGGMVSSAAQYARFLRKLLRGELRMSEYLGEAAVCTLPDPEHCPEAHGSPVSEPWLYSYNHWVELDGSLSSAGLMGFYPWISGDRQHYGLVARESAALNAAWESVQCGRSIRAAWEGRLDGEPAANSRRLPAGAVEH